MLYVGTFSFEHRETEAGYFTCAVEADTPEAAADALIACAKASGKRADLFDPGTRVYLDGFVELPAGLPQGVLFGFTKLQGTGAISCNLPDPVDGVEGYGVAPDEGDVEPAFVIPRRKRPGPSTRERALALGLRSKAKRGR